MISLKQGEFLVKNARKIINKKLIVNSSPSIKEEDWLNQKRGIFVTLNTHPKNELRGCIGFIEPLYTLKEGLIKAAIAASKDPRFEPITKKEIDNITIEVSVLTLPKLMKVKDVKEYLSRIELGKHGLIVELMGYKGILLSQVPVEQKWDEQEFLEFACRKAGIKKDSWINDLTKVYTFESEIFAEEKPKGKIIKRSFKN